MNENKEEKSLDKAIENLEKEINKIKNENKKNQKIRNMKVFNIKLLKTSSFIVAGTLFLGTIGPLTIDTFRDTVPTDYKYKRATYTSTGIEKTINIDKKTYNNSFDTLKIYSEEKENNSNEKYRVVEVYKFNDGNCLRNHSEEEIKNITLKNEIPKDDIKHFRKHLIDTESLKDDELSFIDELPDEQYMMSELKRKTFKEGITDLEFLARFTGISILAVLEIFGFTMLRELSSKIYNKKIDEWEYKWDVKYPIYSTKDLEEKLGDLYYKRNVKSYQIMKGKSR